MKEIKQLKWITENFWVAKNRIIWFLNPSNKIDIDSTITRKDTKIDDNLNNHTSESNDEFDSKLREAKEKLKMTFLIM